MRKWLPVVVSLLMFVVGGILVHYGYDVAGLGLMLMTLLAIWLWALWPDIRNWLKNRKKGH